MRGLLTKTSRRALLAGVVATPVGAMLHPHAGSATLVSSGSRQTVAMQPAANVAPCERLKFALLGDIMLGRYVDDQFEVEERKKGAFGDVLRVLNQYDPSCSIVAGNLECAVTCHPTPTPKIFNFKLSPKHADVLQQLQLSYVSLANNHVLDYQQQGMQETHQVLDNLGVAHSGSGTNIAEASSPAIIIRGGYKVAFLSYADHYDDWAAGTNTPGINYIDPASAKDRQKVQQHIAAVHETHKPDLLLVFVHWGPNWCWQPDKHIRQLGREMLEAGADLVFGHSAHHIQGVEFIGSKAIIYGAGGFIDDYATDDVYRNELGCIWLATFSAPKAAPATAAAAAAAGALDNSTLQQAAAGGGGCDVIWPEDQAGDYHDAHEHFAAVDNDVIRDIGRDQIADSSSSRSGVPPSPTAGAPGSSSSSSSGDRLRLESLTAVPIGTHHVWREGCHMEPGHGDPPYFSQVDLAHGPDYQWVAYKLTQLCKDMGTAVTQLPGERGLQLTAGAEVKWSRGSAAAAAAAGQEDIVCA